MFNNKRRKKALSDTIYGASLATTRASRSGCDAFAEYQGFEKGLRCGLAMSLTASILPKETSVAAADEFATQQILEFMDTLKADAIAAEEEWHKKVEAMGFSIDMENMSNTDIAQAFGVYLANQLETVRPSDAIVQAAEQVLADAEKGER